VLNRANFPVWESRANLVILILSANFPRSGPSGRNFIWCSTAVVLNILILVTVVAGQGFNVSGAFLRASLPTQASSGYGTLLTCTFAMKLHRLKDIFI
jgi:hypothetical protein